MEHIHTRPTGKALGLSPITEAQEPHIKVHATRVDPSPPQMIETTSTNGKKGKSRIRENIERLGDQLQNGSYNLGIRVLRSLQRCPHILPTDFIVEPSVI